MKGPWTEEERYAAREIGHMLLSEGKYALAKNVFAGLIAIDPNDSYSHLCLGIACRWLDQGEEAVEELELALRLDPTLWSAAIHLAEIHLQRKEASDAKRNAFLAERISRTPRCPERIKQRARRLLQLSSQPAA